MAEFGRFGDGGFIFRQTGGGKRKAILPPGMNSALPSTHSGNAPLNPYAFTAQEYVSTTYDQRKALSALRSPKGANTSITIGPSVDLQHEPYYPAPGSPGMGSGSVPPSGAAVSGAAGDAPDFGALVDVMKNLTDAISKNTDKTTKSTDGTAPAKRGAAGSFYSDALAATADFEDPKIGFLGRGYKQAKDKYRRAAGADYARFMSRKLKDDFDPESEEVIAGKRKGVLEKQRSNVEKAKQQYQARLIGAGGIVGAGITSAAAVASEFAARDYKTTTYETEVSAMKAGINAGGTVAGAAIGAMFGSVVPGAGTLVGGSIGAAAGGAVSSVASSAVQSASQGELDVIAATKDSVAAAFATHDRLGIPYPDDMIQETAMIHRLAHERTAIGRSRQTIEIDAITDAREDYLDSALNKNRSTGQKIGKAIKSGFSNATPIGLLIQGLSELDLI